MKEYKLKYNKWPEWAILILDREGLSDNFIVSELDDHLTALFEVLSNLIQLENEEIIKPFIDDERKIDFKIIDRQKLRKVIKKNEDMGMIAMCYILDLYLGADGKNKERAKNFLKTLDFLGDYCKYISELGERG